MTINTCKNCLLWINHKIVAQQFPQKPRAEFGICSHAQHVTDDQKIHDHGRPVVMDSHGEHAALYTPPGFYCSNHRGRLKMENECVN